MPQSVKYNLRGVIFLSVVLMVSVLVMPEKATVPQPYASLSDGVLASINHDSEGFLCKEILDATTSEPGVFTTQQVALAGPYPEQFGPRPAPNGNINAQSDPACGITKSLCGPYGYEDNDCDGYCGWYQNTSRSWIEGKYVCGDLYMTTDAMIAGQMRYKGERYPFGVILHGDCNDYDPSYKNYRTMTNMACDGDADGIDDGYRSCRQGAWSCVAGSVGTIGTTCNAYYPELDLNGDNKVNRTDQSLLDAYILANNINVQGMPTTDKDACEQHFTAVAQSAANRNSQTGPVVQRSCDVAEPWGIVDRRDAVRMTTVAANPNTYDCQYGGQDTNCDGQVDTNELCTPRLGSSGPSTLPSSTTTTPPTSLPSSTSKTTTTTLPSTTAPTTTTTQPGLAVENCTDGIDNDGDRVADCYDSDCCGNTICTYTLTSYQRNLICPSTTTTTTTSPTSNLIITNSNQGGTMNYSAGPQGYSPSGYSSTPMSRFSSTIKRMLGY